MTAIADLPRIFMDDMATLFAGKLIGSGISRNVYTFGHNADYVLKVEYSQGYYQNTAEWLIWERVRGVKAIADWFAPCNSISDMGRWLIQRRTTAVTIDELRKKVPRVPVFFTDLKVGNWGRLGKRIVCHDYGSALVTEYGLTSRMKKADWWE